MFVFSFFIFRFFLVRFLSVFAFLLFFVLLFVFSFACFPLFVLFFRWICFCLFVLFHLLFFCLLELFLLLLFLLMYVYCFQDSQSLPGSGEHNNGIKPEVKTSDPPGSREEDTNSDVRRFILANLAPFVVVRPGASVSPE